MILVVIRISLIIIVFNSSMVLVDARFNLWLDITITTTVIVLSSPFAPSGAAGMHPIGQVDPS